MLLPVLWLMPLCALCTHVCVSTTLCLLSFGSLPHCCSFPELGPMTQTDFSASLLLHLDNINEQIESEPYTHRVSWESPLMVPLRVHMLSIDYQNYQIQKIKVINKTGHPARWTRHIETLNCQPILTAPSHDSSLPTIGRGSQSPTRASYANRKAPSFSAWASYSIWLLKFLEKGDLF